MKVAVIGAKGQLGTDLCRVLPATGDSVVPLTHGDVDVTNFDQVERVLSQIQPDVVISTAAFHKVEVCETEPMQSFAVNAIGPRNLGLTCRRLNAVLVHFSTDYVFSGHAQRAYSESDLPHPLNVYGVSKLAGEGMVALTWDRNFVIRTCGLYGVAGSSGKGGNFVETMLKKARGNDPLRVVHDQVLTPTFTGDLAEVVSQLIRTEAFGLYHVSAEGQCSWYEFACKIFELENLEVDLKPVSSGEFPSPVRRPAYSVLSKAKVGKLGIKMPHWEEGLSQYLSRRTRNQSPVSSASA
jgi:dTDP-4-dehydrorhamnose reductase